MGPWGFVFLAYGIVWGVMVMYFVALKGRLRNAESELAQLRSVEGTESHAQK